MARVSKNKLKSYFETGDTPTQAEFEDLIDSLALQEEVDELKKNMGEDGGEGDNPGISTSGIYVSEIDNKDLEMPEDVGGFDKGTKVSDIEGKTYNEIFDDLLFPTVNPTFINPSASLVFKNYASVQEVGAVGPTQSNFTVGYNPGSINLNGVKQSDRGGVIKLSESYIYVNGDTDNKTLPSKVTLGNTPFRYRAAYSSGPQPKDNKGNNYGDPLPAGVVDSGAITVNGTYPWYASTTGSSQAVPVVKQPLISWSNSMSTGRFKLLPSGTLPQVFKIPRKISTLQMLNTISNSMETVDLTDYKETTENIIIGGIQVTYYVYTYIGSLRGEVTLLVKF